MFALLSGRVDERMGQGTDGCIEEAPIDGPYQPSGMIRVPCFCCITIQASADQVHQVIKALCGRPYMNNTTTLLVFRRLEKRGNLFGAPCKAPKMV